MNRKIKMGVLLTILGTLTTGFGVYLINQGRSESTKSQIEKSTKEITDSNSQNTNEVLNRISELENKLVSKQEIFETYILNVLEPSLNRILKEKGFTIEQIEELADTTLEESKNDFELANAFFIKGNYEKAIHHYQKSLKTAPLKAQPNIYFNLGQSKLKLLQIKFGLKLFSGISIDLNHKILLKEIVNDFSKAIEQNPKNYQALNNRGIVYLKLSELDKAEFDFKRVIKLNPESPQGHNNLAKAYSLKNDPSLASNALKQLNTAIILNPEFWEAYYNRGNLLERNFDEFKKAEEDYLICIRNGFNSKHVYNNLGITYARWGKCDLAETQFDEALKIDKNFQNALIGRRNLKILKASGKCK